MRRGHCQRNGASDSRKLWETRKELHEYSFVELQRKMFQYLRCQIPSFNFSEFHFRAGSTSSSQLWLELHLCLLPLQESYNTEKKLQLTANLNPISISISSIDDCSYLKTSLLKCPFNSWGKRNVLKSNPLESSSRLASSKDETTGIQNATKRSSISIRANLQYTHIELWINSISQVPTHS